MFGLQLVNGDDELIKNWSHPIFGAEEGGDGGSGEDQGGEDDSLDDENNEGDDDSGSDGGDDSGSDEIDPKDKRIKELSQEAAKRRRELRQAQRELAEAKANLTKNSDPDEMDEETRAKIEKPLRDQIDNMISTSRDTAIRNAILAEGQQDGKARRVWHSADTVISQIDMEAIDYDPESGSIEGVSEELDRIAGEQPFLIKEKGTTKKEPSTKEEKQPSGKQGASGKQPGGAGRQVHGMDVNRKKELGQKFPILNRR